MKKMNYKKILLALFLFNLAVSFSAFAEDNSSVTSNTARDQRIEDRQQRRVELQDERQEKFCERISEQATNWEEKLEIKEANIATRREDIVEKWEERVATTDEKRNEWRSRRDANLEQHFQKIKEKAVNDEQKQAAEKFQIAVREAISVRRAAVDGAISTFRAEVKNILFGRKSEVNDIVSDFHDAQKAAWETAKTSCQAGTAPKTVRETLRASLKTGREAAIASRKDQGKIKTSMDTQIEAKRKAIEDANAAFKAAMEAAKTELKKSFPDPDTTPPSPPGM